AVTQYMPARYARLDVEVAGIRARAGQAPSPGVSTAAVPLDDTQDPLEYAGRLAKAHFEATQANSGTTAQAKIEAASQQLEGRFKEFIAGRITADFVLEAERLVLEAQVAAQDKDADPVVAFEALWNVAREVLRITKAKYDAASIAVTQYGEAL